MKLLRNRLEEALAHHKTTLQVIEKDFAIGYVLAGIASQPSLRKTLVFKGGTALKKVFFGDYRFLKT